MELIEKRGFEVTGTGVCRFATPYDREKTTLPLMTTAACIPGIFRSSIARRRMASARWLGVSAAAGTLERYPTETRHNTLTSEAKKCNLIECAHARDLTRPTKILQSLSGIVTSGNMRVVTIPESRSTLGSPTRHARSWAKGFRITVPPQGVDQRHNQDEPSCSFRYGAPELRYVHQTSRERYC